MFITRTFSKLFSMAGCRLGYVVGWSDGVKMVQKMCTPHNTNAFAMMFAEKVLTTPGMLDSLITNFNGGRKYLVNSLDKMGIVIREKQVTSFLSNLRRMHRLSWIE